jgi:hypothetical protein
MSYYYFGRFIKNRELMSLEITKIGPKGSFILTNFEVIVRGLTIFIHLKEKSSQIIAFDDFKYSTS